MKPLKVLYTIFLNHGLLCDSHYSVLGARYQGGLYDEAEHYIGVFDPSNQQVVEKLLFLSSFIFLIDHIGILDFGRHVKNTWSALTNLY